MANAKTVLKETALSFIEAATSLDNVAYLVKSLVDNDMYDSTLQEAVDNKVTALAPTSNAKDVAYTMSALSSSKELDYSIYGIGTVGKIGFGVSCLTALEIPDGFTVGTGYYTLGAPDYARLYDASG